MSPTDATFASMRSSVRSRPAPYRIDTRETESHAVSSETAPAHVLPTPLEDSPPEADSFVGESADRPAEPDRATKLLQHAIDAYRVGSLTIAERALSDAWRLCLPAVRATIAGRIKEHDRRDDAEQGAFLKLWTAVKNWNPDRGAVRNAEATCRWAANFAALNVVEKRDSIAGREHGALDDDVMRDIIEYRADQVRGAGIDDEQAVADYARLVADRAGSPERGRLWAAIVLAAGEGHEDRRSIAEYVSHATGRDIPEVSIRREIFHMVREAPHPRDGIGKLEVVRDWRTREAVADDGGELSLFGYAWQEIS